MLLFHYVSVPSNSKPLIESPKGALLSKHPSSNLYLKAKTIYVVINWRHDNTSCWLSVRARAHIERYLGQQLEVM